MQLMTTVSPQLEQLRKEGESGRRKITQYTRYGTLFLALFPGHGHLDRARVAVYLVLEPGHVPHHRGDDASSPAPCS